MLLEWHWLTQWQDDRPPSSKWTGLCKFSFYLEFTALQCILVLLFKHVSTSKSFCACLGYEHYYSFCVFGLQYKCNHLSSNNSHHASCIHKGLHAGKWPDLMTSKIDALSTLGYHWADCTGTALSGAIAQWSSSGNPVLICIIGTHWKTTGATSTLEHHWNHTIWCQHPVVSKWWSSLNLHNWNTLDHHWKTTGNTLATNNSCFRRIPVYTGV